MLELCPSRIGNLMLDKETIYEKIQKPLTKEQKKAIIKKKGLALGLQHMQRVKQQAIWARQFGLLPGGEFRAAFYAAKKVPGCQVVCGDRPFHIINETSLTCGETFKFFAHAFRIARHRPISDGIKFQEKMEQMKSEVFANGSAGENLTKFSKNYKRALIDERDQYMTNVLHKIVLEGTAKKLAASKKAGVKFEPLNVVAIVGMAHVRGIQANWSYKQNNNKNPVVMAQLKLDHPSMQCGDQAENKMRIWATGLLTM